MSNSLLVCTDGSDYSKTACEYAFHLAHLLKKGVQGLHVLDSRMIEAPATTDTSGWIGIGPFGPQLELFRDITEKKGKAVAKAFNAMAQEKGIQAAIDLGMGHPASEIIDKEADAYMVILGQRGEDAEWIGHMIGSTAERVARHSVKPCLITPGTFRPISRILSGYDGSDHARQAVITASELARKHQFELLLISIADGIDAEHNQRIADEGLALAQSYGIEPRHIIEAGDARERILAAIDEHACDLLVVGAYGHGLIRELLLGSTTTQLISKANVPVMLLR